MAADFVFAYISTLLHFFTPNVKLNQDSLPSQYDDLN